MGGGEGGGPTSAPTTIRLADGANSNAIESPDTKDHTLVLKDLTLDGNRSKNNSGNGIVLNYLQLGTMAEPSTGVEIWNFAENGLKATTPITSIFAQFLYVRGNGKSGILANMIQGSLMSEVYLTTNFAGISAATNDTIISGLYLESNIGWGGTLSLTTSVARIWTKSNGWAGLYLSGDNSIVDLWAANNVQASDSPVAAEVYLYGATNLTLNLNVDGSSQKKPNINGLYMQNNVSGNVIKGHIGASGFGIFLDASSSGWNPAGTTIEGVVIAGSMGGFNTIPPASMIVRNNTGYVTENSGAVTVPIGNSSVIVEHGLADTPVSIQLTPISDTGGKRYWVSQKDSSTFTIAIDSRYSNPIPFTWKAEMY